eukprot:SAG11_NODE_1103_length_5862_cov_8.036439_3_plen_76_part_00
MFDAKVLSEDLGFVGEVTRVNTEPIQKAIDAGYLPVMCSLAESSSGQILNVNADVLARGARISVYVAQKYYFVVA